MSNWYRAGTVAVTNGSNAVAGTGTAWIANVAVSDAIHLPDGRVYEVVAITSDTSITIDKGYLGSNASGQAYAIQPTRGVVRETYDLLNQVRANLGGYMAGALAGKFPDGTAVLPALTFASDTDTGLYRPGANQIGFAAGGTQLALLSSTALLLDVPVTGLGTLQTPTDVTLGRLPVHMNYPNQTGNGLPWGLGSSHAVNVPDNDANAIARAGFYRVGSSSTVANVPDTLFGGVILHIPYSATYSAQTYIMTNGAAGQMWVRHCNNGTWSAWRRVYTQGDAVGTVSQSGGVPTGALIERGSNANGSYTRWADGTQICWNAAGITTNPAAFSDTPVSIDSNKLRIGRWF